MIQASLCVWDRTYESGDKIHLWEHCSKLSGSQSLANIIILPDGDFRRRGGEHRNGETIICDYRAAKVPEK